MFNVVKLAYEYMTRENIEIEPAESFIMTQLAVNIANYVYSYNDNADMIKFNNLLEGSNYFERCYTFLGQIEDWQQHGGEKPEMITSRENVGIMEDMIRCIYENKGPVKS